MVAGISEMNFRDQKQLDSLTGEFCQHLSARNGAGAINWQAALDFLVSSFPGSFGVILLQDSLKKNSAVFWSGDIDSSAIDSYSAHYAHVNPWGDIWKGLPSGSVRISERHSPARQFRGTEFYEDWLLPLSNAEAAVGIKLCGAENFQLHMPFHYDLKRSDLYDDAIARVFTHASSYLKLAVHAERQYAEAFKTGSVDQVCKNSQDPVFVIDARSRIHDCNRQAQSLLKDASVLIVNGKLVINQRKAKVWLESILLGSSKKRDGAGWRMVFQFDRRTLLFELLPLEILCVSRIFSPDRLFALRISSVDFSRKSDFALISNHYRLTPAEQRICELIVSGRSLKETAETLGITKNTARSALKIIFSKTGTRRQGELIALCNQFQTS